MSADLPEYFTAKSLAAHVGISLRTLTSHLANNVGGIRDAKVKVPGLQAHRFLGRGCRKYIGLTTAGRQPAEGRAES